MSLLLEKSDKEMETDDDLEKRKKKKNRQKNRQKNALNLRL
jgi:hypothetical protein